MNSDTSGFTRVISCIDGYNLYFGLREKARRLAADGSITTTHWKNFYWLDVVKLSETLLQKTQRLVQTKYFTARIRGNPAKERRQSKFLDAISALPNIRLYFGVFQPDPKQCQNCGAIAFHPQEKRTDVNIANQMICDAVAGRFDTALLISGDSDHVPTIETVRQTFGKNVIVAFPPKRESADLQAVATATFRIGKAKFESSLLPRPVILPNGRVIECPTEWVLASP